MKKKWQVCTVLNGCGKGLAGAALAFGFCLTTGVLPLPAQSNPGGSLPTGLTPEALPQTAVPVPPPAYASPLPPTPMPLTPSASASKLFVPTTATGALTPFDPYLDNHLKAPAVREGLFGAPVAAVEKVLRGYGAKPYSYTFGKCSRYSFSVYIVSLHFDRERRVGSITVEPRPPFSLVEPQAQSFFLKLFLEGADPARFRTTVSRDRLEISFIPPLPASANGPATGRP